MKSRLPVSAPCALLVFVASLGLADPVIREFAVPTPNAQPLGIRVDDHGRVWFAEFAGKKIGRFRPAQGRFDEFPVTHSPRDVAANAAGTMLFTEDSYGNGHYGVLRPRRDVLAEYATGLPGASAVDCTLDPSGAFWFNGWDSRSVCRVDADGLATFVPPTFGYMSGVAEDAEGCLWFTAVGGGEVSPRLVRLDPRAAVPGTSAGFTEIPLPHARATLRSPLAANGRIWFTLQDLSKIGCYDPITGQFAEFPTPTSNAAPFKLAVDRWGRIWFTEHLGNKIGMLDPRTGSISEFDVPTSNSLPAGIAVDLTADIVWFTERAGNRIGMLHMPPPDLGYEPSPPTTVHYVSLSGRHRPPFRTWATAATNIQAAVDVARDSSTVMVADGIYDLQSPVTIGKGILVVSANGPAGAIVRGRYDISCFSMSHSRAILDGFTVTGAGTGIYVDHAGTIRNCRIVGTSSSGGSGVVLDGGGVLRDSVVSSNTHNVGGGVLCRDGGLVEDCLIAGNVAAATGGGIECQNGGTVRRCTVKGNRASFVGGGMRCLGGGLVEECALEGNAVLSAGGGGIWAGSGVVVRACMVMSNSAPEGGGAYLYLGGRLEDCALEYNTATGHGGGVYCEGGGVVSGGTVRANAAGGYGGGICRGVVEGCVITDNAAAKGGGGTVHSDLSDCMISGNTAQEFGGGSYYGTMRRCVVSGNSALWCGGGAVVADLTDCVVSGNVAQTYGGGLYFGSLSNCLVCNNAAVSAWGGGTSMTTNFHCVLRNNSAECGGGADHSLLLNCTLVGNSAELGGGAYESVLWGSLLLRNSAVHSGGGAVGSTLKNCTVVFNRAGRYGGGTIDGENRNGIVYYNTASNGSPNVRSSACTYTCTTPWLFGEGNTTNEPLMVDHAHIHASSPCVGAGAGGGMVGTDIDGDAWGHPPSMGCDEPAGSSRGPLGVRIVAESLVAPPEAELEFRAEIEGQVRSNRWAFGDGARQANSIYAAHAWNATGAYEVVLTAYNDDFPAGVSAAVTVMIVPFRDVFADVNSSSPVPPFASWATAARSIQEAVDEASKVEWGRVWVAPGVYAAGSRIVSNHATASRVVVTNNVLIRSVGGPGSTLIVGAPSPGGGNGPGAVRCVYMTAGALDGFTLTNGYTDALSGSGIARLGGGGYLEGAVVRNCRLTGNGAGFHGGGAFGGILRNCELVGNSAYGGAGASSASLAGCEVRGNRGQFSAGVSQSTLTDCDLLDNVAENYGGAAHSSTLSGCRLIRNAAANGGGAYHSTLKQCRLVENAATGVGGGTFIGTASECTYVGNMAQGGGGADHGGQLADCNLSSNVADYGGGVYGSGLTRCRLTGNRASTLGGGAHRSGLSDCTLAENIASLGGGACDSRLTACLVAGNRADRGGGAAESRLRNCLIVDNTAAADAGGLYRGTAICCTISGNAAGGSGGGAHGVMARSCIIEFNAAALGSNWIGGEIDYSCTSPPASNGSHSIAVDPLLVSPGAGDYRLMPFSPCIDTGLNEDWMTNAVDLSGNARIVGAAVDMGAHECQEPNPDTDGDGLPDAWEWGYFGSLAQGPNGDPDGDGFNNAAEYRNGTDPTVPDPTPTHYVDVNASNPVPPYVTWETAARTIQAGLDAAEDGDEVLVAEGLYAPASEIVVTRALHLCAVGGAVIDGGGVRRCLSISNRNAVVEAFTICRGNAYSSKGGAVRIFDTGGTLRGCVVTDSTAMEGGGVFCASNGVVEQCVIVSNRVNAAGGGVSCQAGGVVSGCDIRGNQASYRGGGVEIYGLGSVQQCVIRENTAPYGAGVHVSYTGTLENCQISRNRCNGPGAGVRVWSGVRILSCTIADNSAISTWSAGVDAHGESLIQNSIVCFNTNSAGLANYGGEPAFVHSCVSPLLPSNGVGNIDADPLFEGGGSYRLTAGSPCIDAGAGEGAPDCDLTGIPRPLDGNGDGVPVHDMGAHEFVYVGGGSNAPTGGADSDGDGLPDADELLAGTCPVDETSCFAISPSRTVRTDEGVELRWPSSEGRLYNVYRSVDLLAGFLGIAADLEATPPENVYVDAGRTSSPCFYRISARFAGSE